MSEKIARYRDFWPFYLREHSKRATRNLHFAGTLTAIGCVVLAVAMRRPALAPTAVVAGYGPAWIAHFFVEKNRPATFTYPLWSLFSDFRMAALWLVGGLENELQKAGAGR